jgi:hypothetical protein
LLGPWKGRRRLDHVSHPPMPNPLRRPTGVKGASRRSRDGLRPPLTPVGRRSLGTGREMAAARTFGGIVQLRLSCSGLSIATGSASGSFRTSEELFRVPRRAAFSQHLAPLSYSWQACRASASTGWRRAVAEPSRANSRLQPRTSFANGRNAVGVMSVGLSAYTLFIFGSGWMAGLACRT